MTKRIRKYKLLLGSLILGMFVSGCGNEKINKPDTQCYKPAIRYDSTDVSADSLKNAGSQKKADSVRKHKRSDMSGCYMPRKEKH